MKNRKLSLQNVAVMLMESEIIIHDCIGALVMTCLLI